MIHVSLWTFSFSHLAFFFERENFNLHHIFKAKIQGCTKKKYNNFCGFPFKFSFFSFSPKPEVGLWEFLFHEFIRENRFFPFKKEMAGETSKEEKRKNQIVVDSDDERGRRSGRLFGGLGRSSKISRSWEATLRVEKGRCFPIWWKTYTPRIM